MILSVSKRFVFAVCTVLLLRSVAFAFPMYEAVTSTTVGSALNQTSTTYVPTITSTASMLYVTSSTVSGVNACSTDNVWCLSSIKSSILSNGGASAFGGPAFGTPMTVPAFIRGSIGSASNYSLWQVANPMTTVTYGLNSFLDVFFDPVLAGQLVGNWIAQPLKDWNSTFSWNGNTILEMSGHWRFDDALSKFTMTVLGQPMLGGIKDLYLSDQYNSPSGFSPSPRGAISSYALLYGGILDMNNVGSLPYFVQYIDPFNVVQSAGASMTIASQQTMTVQSGADIRVIATGSVYLTGTTISQSGNSYVTGNAIIGNALSAQSLSATNITVSSIASQQTMTVQSGSDIKVIAIGSLYLTGTTISQSGNSYVTGNQVVNSGQIIKGGQTVDNSTVTYLSASVLTASSITQATGTQSTGFLGAMGYTSATALNFYSFVKFTPQLQGDSTTAVTYKNMGNTAGIATVGLADSTFTCSVTASIPLTGSSVALNLPVGCYLSRYGFTFSMGVSAASNNPQPAVTQGIYTSVGN